MASAGYAQVKKHYTIEDDDQFDALVFTLTATSGSYFISPTSNPNPINIYGNLSEESIEPEFDAQTNQRVNYVSLNFKETKDQGIRETLSNSIFGDKDTQEEDDKWNVYINQEKPLCLNLEYGIGDAMMDLSGIPIEKLKIITGSADVKVGYHPNHSNKVDMDTLYVKVDWGSVEFEHMELSRAKEVIADVGFGNLTLDFSSHSPIRSNITATVGAGKLEVLIPKMDAPVRVNVINSPLCHVKLAKSFREIEENVFVNKSYTEDAENLLTFNLDVALGNIVFKEKKK